MTSLSKPEAPIVSAASTVTTFSTPDTVRLTQSPGPPGDQPKQEHDQDRPDARGFVDSSAATGDVWDLNRRPGLGSEREYSRAVDGDARANDQ